jgi:hypothetical protein
MAMSRYTKQQIAKMVVDPNTPDMISSYPRLNDILPKGSYVKDLNKQIQYMAWVYDYNSPAVKEFSDITRRKEWAKQTVDLKEKPNFELMLNFTRYVINSRVWTLICSLEATFEEYAERVNKRIEDQDGGKEIDVLKAVEIKNKLINQMDEMIHKIESLYNKLFSGDEDAIDEFEEARKFRPEYIAAQMKKK